jgi:NAD(P)-dependent dehydrogenase (short-subunit alcohol dehydrogenase family)
MSWSPADLPSFAGRTAIVTGANSGLGLVTARELARVGARVILACRNVDKGNAAMAGMIGDVQVRRLDLQNLESVREFSESIGLVDVLINNAGIMAVPYALTRDGFESQIGTNHLGHFALTNLLLPKISDRVVTVSSLMHWTGVISLKDLNWKARPYSAWLAYGQSKLANLLFTRELQRRLSAAGSTVKAHAAHPGYSATNLQGHTGNPLGTPFWLAANKLAGTSAEYGATPTLYAASEDLPQDSFVGPKFGARGPIGPVGRSPLARSGRTARDLWRLSEELTEVGFPL